MVTPSGVAGLEFRDEADTVNALVPQLEARGVQAIVVLIHEGGIPFGDYNECPGIAGPIVDIVKRLDKAVAVVVSGHTHRAYNCRIDGHLVTSADKYGTVLTRIDVTLDRATHRIVTAQADNIIVRTAELAKDAAQTALIAAYDDRAKPLYLDRAAEPGWRDRARRHHRRCSACRDELARGGRRRHRIHQSGRRAHRTRPQRRQ
jgi:5'-nucleotidase